MEVSALKHANSAIGHGSSALLRLQPDSRLITLIRRGNQTAFEALVGRYQSRLLAFCRHMLGSKEDAEDVLQEVFTAAFNAILRDEREINVRPWLYRIARNRCLNHMRRTHAMGTDSMDVHIADGGLTTEEKVDRRENFRLLMGDIGQLPESQRTALLLREIDALSYDQIAEVMESTVPSVKSLLVRARVSLAEAAEARKLSCEEVREELGEVAEGLKRMIPPVRRHVRNCARCASFRSELKQTNRALAAIMPLGPLLILKKLLITQLGTTTAGGGSAAGAAAGSAATSSTVGGLVSTGLSAAASKAAAGLATAAIVTAGAVEVKHVTVDTPRKRSEAAKVAAAPAPFIQRTQVQQSQLQQPALATPFPGSPSESRADKVESEADSKNAKEEKKEQQPAAEQTIPVDLTTVPDSSTPPAAGEQQPTYQPVAQEISDTTKIPSNIGKHTGGAVAPDETYEYDGTEPATDVGSGDEHSTVPQTPTPPPAGDGNPQLPATPPVDNQPQPPPAGEPVPPPPPGTG